MFWFRRYNTMMFKVIGQYFQLILWVTLACKTPSNYSTYIEYSKPSTHTISIPQKSTRAIDLDKRISVQFISQDPQTSYTISFTKAMVPTAHLSQK